MRRERGRGGRRGVGGRCRWRTWWGWDGEGNNWWVEEVGGVDS